MADGSPALLEEDDGQYFYDVFATEACTSEWALVQANHSSGSDFNFLLMRHAQAGWVVVAVADVRLDTPKDDPLFAAADLSGDGVDPATVTARLGLSTTAGGRPVFGP
jgi:hypothetical protein